MTLTVNILLTLSLTFTPSIAQAVADVATASSYALKSSCSGSSFFSCFDFFTGADPTNGFVQYVNASYASAANLTRTTSNSAYIGVDTTHVFPVSGPGRPSVRIQSKASYTHGLYILSLSHMPYGCGTWPAFWSLGPNWPAGGEIDIIEGVNLNSQDLISLHTSANCTTAGANERGTLLTSDCGPDATNTGCGVQARSNSSYGEGLDRAGGGIYAMEWTSQYIRVWFFTKASAPPSIAAGKPDPSTFGLPAANFQGSCDMDKHFTDHGIVFDQTFCGDFAGNTYGSSSCPMTAGQSGYQSCIDFVANNPRSFTDAYWEIDYLRVYQTTSAPPQSSSAKPSSSTSLSSVKPAASTSSISSFSLAMGKSSSSGTGTSKKSPSLFIPSSSPTPTAKTSSRSTYIGPNTLSTKPHTTASPTMASRIPGLGDWTTTTTTWTTVTYCESYVPASGTVKATLTALRC